MSVSRPGLDHLHSTSICVALCGTFNSYLEPQPDYEYGSFYCDYLHFTYFLHYQCTMVYHSQQVQNALTFNYQHYQMLNIIVYHSQQVYKVQYLNTSRYLVIQLLLNLLVIYVCICIL